MIEHDVVKALLIRGDFPDMGRLLNEAYVQGKKIFKCKTRIKVVHAVQTPFGWVVLVARSRASPMVVDAASGRVEAEKRR